MIGVIPLNVRIQQAGVTAAAVGGRRKFNDLLRGSLLLAAKHWIANYLPLHFRRGASGRYNYTPRSVGYEAQKRRYEQQGVVPIGSGIRGVRPGSFENLPLVFSGDMREQVLTQAYNPRATATSTRQQVRVPIPLGHPVQLTTAAEVSVLRQDELQDMHNVAARDLFAKFSQIGVENVEAA